MPGLYYPQYMSTSPRSGRESDVHMSRSMCDSSQGPSSKPAEPFLTSFMRTSGGLVRMVEYKMIRKATIRRQHDALALRAIGHMDCG